MLFNSYEFFIFFPLVTILFYLIPHRFRWMHLLVASCIFYMAFVPVYIVILAGTIVIDYLAGILIESSVKHKKAWLVLSIIANTGVLAVFKYYNFFITNINEASGSHLLLLKILLPIGLSFHTFQAMSYTIEVYRGQQKAERHFGIYALYVMFYPQLVAGPIERPQNVLHQFHEVKEFSYDNLLAGLRLMMWGFFKKLVIADRAAVYADIIFPNAAAYHYGNVVIAVLMFSIQIYCDFSGYSDIAKGAAKTMGYELMVNFNRPYFANNIREFWSRWHISLSTWFRDYVYIPLGGNRRSKWRTYFNTAAIFLLSGFWHGAAWTFIIWGALHTVYIVVFMLFSRKPAALPITAIASHDLVQQQENGFPLRLPRTLVSYVLTMALVAFAWIFFRAENVHQGIQIARDIFTLHAPQAFATIVRRTIPSAVEFDLFYMAITVSMAALMFVTEYFSFPDLSDLNRKSWVDILFCTTILTLIICFGMFQKASFIYFQF